MDLHATHTHTHTSHSSHPMHLQHVRRARATACDIHRVEWLLLTMCVHCQQYGMETQGKTHSPNIRHTHHCTSAMMHAESDAHVAAGLEDRGPAADTIWHYINDTISMTRYQYKSNNVCIQIQQCMHADTTLHEYRYNSVWTQIQHYMNTSTTILEHKYNKKKIHMQLKYKPRFSDSRIHVCRWWAHAAAGDEYRVATAVRACRSGAARCLSI